MKNFKSFSEFINPVYEDIYIDIKKLEDDATSEKKSNINKSNEKSFFSRCWISIKSWFSNKFLPNCKTVAFMLMLSFICGTLLFKLLILVVNLPSNIKIV